MIKATLELVREKGCLGFTLNEASRRAGVSKSAPYNHFEDKTSLLAEIAVLGNQTMEAELRAAASHGESVREKLLLVILAYIQFAISHRQHFQVMFQSGIDKSEYPELRAAASKAFGVGAELAGSIETSPESANALALACWTMAHGFACLMVEGNFDRVSDSKVTIETAKQLALGFLIRS